MRSASVSTRQPISVRSRPPALTDHLGTPPRCWFLVAPGPSPTAEGADDPQTPRQAVATQIHSQREAQADEAPTVCAGNRFRTGRTASRNAQTAPLRTLPTTDGAKRCTGGLTHGMRSMQSITRRAALRRGRCAHSRHRAHCRYTGHASAWTWIVRSACRENACHRTGGRSHEPLVWDKLLHDHRYNMRSLEPPTTAGRLEEGRRPALRARPSGSKGRLRACALDFKGSCGTRQTWFEMRRSKLRIESGLSSRARDREQGHRHGQSVERHQRANRPRVAEGEERPLEDRVQARRRRATRRSTVPASPVSRASIRGSPRIGPACTRPSLPQVRPKALCAATPVSRNDWRKRRAFLFFCSS